MPTHDLHLVPGPPDVLEEIAFEGEQPPLLLQRRVVFGIAGAFALIAGLYIVATIIFDFPTSFDAEPFKTWVDDRGALGPLVFILVLALAVLFAPIPNVPIFIAAGLAWGPFLGSVYSLAGTMLGSVLAFYSSRWLGRRHLPRLIGRRMADRLDRLVENFGGRVVFWARMLPVVNFDWVSYVAGMTKIGFVPFFLYSFLGMLLPTFIAVAAGDSLGKDLRITLGLGAIWVIGIVGSAAFFWTRRSHTATY